ncbi:hypothetical protein ZIOFF_028804 [Zingiber officinale]|uniref:Uncharacterized protein n=1 Tax=Zingiber officinale TaxID=94328 RepID=A0A8J5GNK7_ZINOF|nr:hypothetical protein ZIOFF_028804 [Zingiber officinale]
MDASWFQALEVDLEVKYAYLTTRESTPVHDHARGHACVYQRALSRCQLGVLPSGVIYHLLGPGSRFVSLSLGFDF